MKLVALSIERASKYAEAPLLPNQLCGKAIVENDKVRIEVALSASAI